MGCFGKQVSGSGLPQIDLTQRRLSACDAQAGKGADFKRLKTVFLPPSETKEKAVSRGRLAAIV